VAEATVAHLVVMPRVVRPKAFYVANSPEGELPAGRISRAQRLVNLTIHRESQAIRRLHSTRDCTLRPARRPMPFGQPEGYAVSLLQERAGCAAAEAMSALLAFRTSRSAGVSNESNRLWSRERSSTWRSASGAPVRPEGRVPHL
jgi:hypothetical protein